MKKLLCVLLAIIVAFSVTGTAFAATDKKTDTPFIIIPGFLQTNLNYNDDNCRVKKVWFPDISDNIGIVIKKYSFGNQRLF